MVMSASGTLNELMRDCRDEEAADQVREVASIILRSCLSAIGLISNLLGLARAGQVPGEVSEVDVRKKVEGVLKEKEAHIKRKETRVIVDDDLGHIMADPTHIYQIFSNLIGNAVEYNDNPEPEVIIAYEKVDGAHGYRVRDNGSGISPHDAEKVFLPLYRGKFGGTGLGLAIVKRIVEVYGGAIRAYNDGGTCFEFTLKDLHRGS